MYNKIGEILIYNALNSPTEKNLSGEGWRPPAPLPPLPVNTTL